MMTEEQKEDTKIKQDLKKENAIRRKKRETDIIIALTIFSVIITYTVILPTGNLHNRFFPVITQEVPIPQPFFTSGGGGNAACVGGDLAASYGICEYGVDNYGS